MRMQSYHRHTGRYRSIHAPAPAIHLLFAVFWKGQRYDVWARGRDEAEELGRRHFTRARKVFVTPVGNDNEPIGDVPRWAKGPTSKSPTSKNPTGKEA